MESDSYAFLLFSEYAASEPKESIGGSAAAEFAVIAERLGELVTLSGKSVKYRHEAKRLGF